MSKVFGCTMLAVVLALGAACAPGGGLTPATLRCEYKVDPQGLHEKAPRLSWIVTSTRRAQNQTAYRILVAGSESKLRSNVGDLWDSGKVLSCETAQIIYEGDSLGSGQRCFWKVQVWDRDDRPSGWSEPAFWSMGLLDESDWAARWISAGPYGQLDTAATGGLILPPPRYFRKDFTLPGKVQRATLYATALGLYHLSINGHAVGADYFTPGWTDYDRRVYYQTYDVTDLVARGANTLGAILTEGWYAGYVGWKRQREHYGDRPQLRVRLEVEYGDGAIQAVTTDDTWQTSTGPILEADFLMGETYDARLELPGWDVPGFDNGAWLPVQTAAPQLAVQAHPGPPVRVYREIEPVAITEPETGAYVLDMGTNFAGVVRLRVQGAAGQKIVLRFAERLNPDGTIYTTNLRGARATDTYICKGAGVETWSPRFTFHGFQYVEVRGLSGPPGPGDIVGLELTSATPAAGRLVTSDDMINALYRNILQTQRANFIDIPTDCPQRDERLGWTGDAQIYIRTATYNTDVAAFFTKWLVDLMDAQSEDGAFPDVAPRKVATGGGTAAWADAGVICPWTIYQVYGDTRVLERHYGHMAAWIDYCRDNSAGLLRPAKGYGDWLSIEAGTPKDVLATAYFAGSTRLMARVAETLGKQEDAAAFCQLFDEIRTAFRQAYVNDKGRIKGDTQTVYVLALTFDLVDSTQRGGAARRLIELIEERDWHLSTGFVGTKDLMTSLTAMGRTDVAYRLLHNETFPSWGFSIRHGATSIWERWDGWTPDSGFQDPGMNSFAHYSFGAVAEWLFKTVGGIDTDGPGYRRITIRPRPGGKMRHAKASYYSMRGLIATAWELDGEQLQLEVTIPANTTATVSVPVGNDPQVTESGQPAGEAEGVRLLRMEDDVAVYEVGSGDYAFISSGVQPIPMPQ